LAAITVPWGNLGDVAQFIHFFLLFGNLIHPHLSIATNFSRSAERVAHSVNTLP